MTLLKGDHRVGNPFRGLSVFEVTVLGALKSNRAKMLTLLGLIPPIITVLFALFQPMTSTPPQKDVRQLFTQAFVIFYLILFGWIVTLIFATSLVADEKRDRTLSYFLTRPISRAELVLWKWISLEIILALAFLVPVFSFYVAMEGAIGLNEQDLARGFEEIIKNSEVGFHAYYVLFVVSSAYGAILMFLGIVIDRPIIVGGLILFGELFVLRGLMVSLNLSLFSLSSHMQNIAEEFLYFAGPPEDFPFTVLESHSVYLLIILGSLIASILAVHRMDFP
ncbi:MAG: ABC transporter permease [Candidatus Hodarchaeota archaeon]